jgi:hypothetical protein
MAETSAADEARTRLRVLGQMLLNGSRAPEGKAKATNGKANAAEGAYTVVDGLSVCLQIGQRALDEAHALEPRVAALENVVETLVQELVARTAKQ